MPPVKPYNPNKVGEHVQYNYNFLEKLFGANQKAFRDGFFNCASENALRQMLHTHDIDIPAPIRLIIVDIENGGRVKVFPPAINPQTDDYYLLVMPPVPRRDPSAIYKHDQSWEGAWHHAIVDGYGM